jgi:hypothetical protein
MVASQADAACQDHRRSPKWLRSFVSEGQDVNGPDLHVSSGRLDDSDRRFVRPGEGLMKRSRPGGEIGQREI